MKELRDIKIDILTGNKNPIVDLFNEITKDTMIIKCDVYHKHGLEFIYFANAKTAEQYHKDGEWIFYQDCKNEKFWCNYTRYWSLFESNFGLDYVEIQSITKYLVEEALKREVGTPVGTCLNPLLGVEEALKREVGTPYGREYSPARVEEALKREVGTPKLSNAETIPWVEEALKREVGTPFNNRIRSYLMVEEALKREVGTPKLMSFKLFNKVEEALKREVENNNEHERTQGHKDKTQ